MKRVMRFSVIVAGALGVALSAGCGGDTEGATVTAAGAATTVATADTAAPVATAGATQPAGSSGPPCTRVDVPAELLRIRAGKREMATAPPPKLSATSEPQTTNSGDYAYASLPIDLTGPGRYTLRFGPVDDFFDVPRIQMGVAFQQADDFTAQVHPVGRSEMTTDPDGKRYLKFDVQIENVSPCTSYVMFVY
ncbi:hypothetical protein Ga0074812_106337 [Parafrankia irregularis]|uniref:Lipoprotein n=1 Tax=Parafrankia irregularis TaxID=795642 RepID=A0A0S4QLY8_9ACTN|nr:MULTISPECIES: hypothetical protein [Parafrankia]MBE3202329.1 hypothetical protein [Parafrankia sp. CH37]CUU56082.1 hypothetical protein Ga0074812_106337 [Parafrankia irregularis]